MPKDKKAISVHTEMRDCKLKLRQNNFRKSEIEVDKNIHILH